LAGQRRRHREVTRLEHLLEWHLQMDIHAGQLLVHIEEVAVVAA
jgi:hypothetical protein